LEKKKDNELKKQEKWPLKLKWNTFRGWSTSVWSGISDESLQLLVQVQHVFSTMASHSETPLISCQLMLHSLIYEKESFTFHIT
jgi:hypothetical protein